MSLKDVTQHEFNRRDFLRLSGIAGAGVVLVACGAAPGGAGEAAAPAASEAAASERRPRLLLRLAPLPIFPREKTLAVMFGGDGTQYTDVGLGNPYATGYSFQMGNAALSEPLYF